MGKSNKTDIVSCDAARNPDNHSCDGAHATAHASGTMVQALDSSWPGPVPVAVPVASALVRWRGPGSALAPFSPASAPMAQKFPLYRTGRDQDVGHSGSTKEMGTHDD